MSELGTQVTGPVLKLAAQVKALLEGSPQDTMVRTSYGTFYVSRVVLSYSDAENEIVGYLVPDEGEGETFDFYTPESAS